MPKSTLENALMPWPEVRRRWNLQSGERISRARVWQIAKQAEAKMRKKLETLKDEMGAE